MLHDARHLRIGALQPFVLFLVTLCTRSIAVKFSDGAREVFSSCIAKEFDFVNVLMEFEENAQEKSSGDKNSDIEIAFESITRDLFVLMHDMVHKDVADLPDIDVAEFIGIMHNAGYMAISSNMKRAFYSKLAVMSLQGSNMSDIISLASEESFIRAATGGKGQDLRRMVSLYWLQETGGIAEAGSEDMYNKMLISPESALYLLFGFVDNLKVSVEISGGTIKIQRATGRSSMGVSDVNFCKQNIQKLVVDGSAMCNMRLYVEDQLAILHWFAFFLEIPLVEIDGWQLNKGCASSISKLAARGLKVRRSWVSEKFFKSLEPMLFASSCGHALSSGSTSREDTAQASSEEIKDASGEGMSESTCDELLRELCSRNRVTHLDISGNRLNERHLKMISRMSSLEVLYMGGCNTELGSIECFKNAAFRDTLSELYVCDNRMNRSDMEGIMALKGLKSLYLSYDRMHESDMGEVENKLNLRVFFAVSQ